MDITSNFITLALKLNGHFVEREVAGKYVAIASYRVWIPPALLPSHLTDSSFEVVFLSLFFLRCSSGVTAKHLEYKIIEG